MKPQALGPRSLGEPTGPEESFHRFGFVGAIGERELTTRDGVVFHVRPAHPGDEAALADFFLQVDPEDLYYRFLSGLNHVDQARLARMTRGDDPCWADFIALEKPGGSIVAAAMLTILREGQTAEFALCTRADKRHRGISWALLEHLVFYAQTSGIAQMQSIQPRVDCTAIDLERQMGFEIRRHPGNPALAIAHKELRLAHGSATNMAR